MKKLNWRLTFSMLLIFLSVIFYCIHYFIFKDVHHIFIYFVGDLAFIPIEVLLVSLIIDKVIHERELEARLEKLNIIIGLFFNEIGTNALKYFISSDTNIEKISSSLQIDTNWNEKEFKHALEKTKKYHSNLTLNYDDLEKIKVFLISKREFLLKLLANQNLLEHETFTHLLTAIFHLEEELPVRDLSHLTPDDQDHLKTDMIRVYDIMISQWVLYMKYLKKTFPYFFVTAMSDNPFVNRV